MSNRDDLISLLAARSARRGTFTLASGRQSSLYIDARMTTMSPGGPDADRPTGVGGFSRRRLGTRCRRRAHARRGPDRVRAGDGECNDVATIASVHGTQRSKGPRRGQVDRGALSNRGIASSSSRTRSRPAARRAPRRRPCARQAAIVIGVLALVDREEGGREALAAEGLDVVALATASEIVAAMEAAATSPQ